MEKNNSGWMTGGPWYNTCICKQLYRNVFEGFIINARTDRYNIMCYIDTHENKLFYQNMMMEGEVVIIHYHQIQQQCQRA